MWDSNVDGYYYLLDPVGQTFPTYRALSTQAKCPLSWQMVKAKEASCCGCCPLFKRFLKFPLAGFLDVIF